MIAAGGGRVAAAGGRCRQERLVGAASQGIVRWPSALLEPAQSGEPPVRVHAGPVSVRRRVARHRRVGVLQVRFVAEHRGLAAELLGSVLGSGVH